MTDNMKIWNTLKRPPLTALKKITGGRLSGMTDIKPQWRYEAMTELFGPVGDGWKYTNVSFWTEEGSEAQWMCFCSLNLLYRKANGEWSDPIPGVGGAMLVTKEKSGLHSSDEGFKMAQTDALSVAMKALGVGADIYSGQFDGSKYKDSPAEKHTVEADPVIIGTLRSCESLEQLQTVWKSLSQEQREACASIKDEMKAKLSDER